MICVTGQRKNTREGGIGECDDVATLRLEVTFVSRGVGCELSIKRESWGIW